MSEKAPAGGGWSWREAFAVLLAGMSVAFDFLAANPLIERRELDVALSVACLLGAVAVMLWPIRSTMALMAGLRPDPNAPTRLAWLSLKTMREVMLASQTAGRDRWAVVSIRHLDRVGAVVAGVLVYDPSTHRVVMVARGVTAHPIPPRPLADFGLTAPRPYHVLTLEQTRRVRGVLGGAR